MQARLRRSVIPVALAAIAFALAIAQRPGWAASDTKIDLHVDPSGFLADVFSVWSPTGSTGHVQGGQYAGYLFPMGPFFALLRAVGTSPWLTQRLWLGLVLALAAWGMVRLLDELLTPTRGWGHLAAGLMILLNAYVVTLADRTSVTLIALAAMPWLLVSVRRGLGNPSGWAAPIGFALLVGVSGGGVNAAVTAWMLVGPIILAAYEVAIGSIRPRAIWSFAVRAVPLAALVSLWWVVPVLSQARYGTDFLAYTEQPGTIWQTPSLTESLRLMGYWVSYVGVGFTGTREAYFSTASAYLFFVPVVVATILAAAIPLLGLAWTRRDRYGPFFGVLVVVGAVIMGAGWPNGTPLRDASYFVYNHFPLLQFLRTTYKAGPLVAVGLAGLGGLAAARLAQWISERRGQRATAFGAAAIASTAAVLALAAWPLVSGRAVDSNVTWKRVPGYWTKAARSLDRELPANQRAMLIPGSLYSFYRWGGTIDPILPALTDRPVAGRSYVPWTDARATDLTWTIDRLVQQQRVQPGQLSALLRLMSVGRAVSATDADRGKSGVTAPLDASWALASDGGLGRATAAGRTRRFTASGPGIPPEGWLPDIRWYDIRGPRGIVSVLPRDPQMVVDGSAESLAALAGLGRLPAGRAIFYAADRSPAQIRAAAQHGAQLVVADGNRRRASVPSRMGQSAGWTLARRDDVPVDGLRVDPFPDAGIGAQTVATFGNAVESISAPFSPGSPQFPEYRPYLAFDGDPGTAWRSDGVLALDQRYVDIVFDRARKVPYVDVLPYQDRRAVVREVTVNGRPYSVGPGWNRLRLAAPTAAGLRLGLSKIDTEGRPKGGGGGLREVRIPGIRATEQLRLPELAESALAGVGPATRLSYVITRTTADDPYRRRAPTSATPRLAPRNRQDPEYAIERIIRPPFAALWALSGLATVAPLTPDSWIDRAVGASGPLRADSSGRFLGRPGWRASMAFDGSRRTAWVGSVRRGSRPWLGWETDAPGRLTNLRLVPAGGGLAFPRLVRIVADGKAVGVFRVGRAGAITLRRPPTARTFRLEILSLAGRDRQEATRRRAPAVGVGEVLVPGLGRVVTKRAGSFRSQCGAAVVRARPQGGEVRMRIGGSIANLDRGLPVALSSCRPGDRLAMPGGREVGVAGRPQKAVIETLLLDSPAVARPVAKTGGGRVVGAGRAGRDRWSGVRLDLSGPSWLAFGQTWNPGWRASCDGRDLGEPVPIDGYANGWPVTAECSSVEFNFAPMKAVRIGYFASLAGLAGSLVALGLILLRRRKRSGKPVAAQGNLPDDRGTRSPPLRAAGVGLVFGLVFGFLFGLRAGVVVGPACFLILWLGLRNRTLFLVAGAMLGLVVPVLYVAVPVDNQGGYSFEYSYDLVSAHWVAVFAISLITIGLARTIGAARR